MPRKRSKKVYLENTEVPPSRTAGEIITLLVESGARQIMQEFDDKKHPVGIRFTIAILPNQVNCIMLPVRTEPVFKLLKSQANGFPDQIKLRAKAERVAWRQLFRWCQAQMAMVQTGMAEAGEVFLPYIQHESGKTFFEHIRDSGMKLLPEKTA